MKTSDMTTEQQWQAVQARDVGADGRFVFAVKTTGVYCRPSCNSRQALRKNVLFFATPAAAQAEGFRPCKRCQPDKLSPEQQRTARVVQACRILAESERPLTLEEIASSVAMSPYHFHRLFKSVTGLTPNAWQLAQRAGRLRDALQHGDAVTRAVFDAGFQAGSSYYHQADNVLGMTARQFRSGAAQMTLSYSIAPCDLGFCLVARSERGICAILLGDDEQAVRRELGLMFPQAQLSEGDSAFDTQLEQVIACIHAPGNRCDLPLDIRGTAFQQQVWQALRDIPAGQTASYQDIARRIGKPAAVRAVAGACAANILAVVIPCHRVVRSSGALSGYRWGVERKATLLARESQHQEE